MSVRLDVRDRVAYLTLDRPGSMNAIDENMLAALPGLVAAVRVDRALKAMVVTGAGDAFCVGLDIELLGRAFDDVDYFMDVVGRLKTILCDLESIDLPVVAAVNGLARAGGFELMLACDLVIAAEDARLGDTHLAFGVVPGGGASQRLPRRIGHQRARELILTGRWIDGREAADIGLALSAVPRASLDDAVEELAARFRPLSRDCLAATKSAMDAGADLPLPQALDVELEHFRRYLTDVPSAREGYLAYVEGREPSWDR